MSNQLTDKDRLGMVRAMISLYLHELREVLSPESIRLLEKLEHITGRAPRPEDFPHPQNTAESHCDGR